MSYDMFINELLYISKVKAVYNSDFSSDEHAVCGNESVSVFLKIVFSMKIIIINYTMFAG